MAWQGPVGAPPMRACGRGALGGLPPKPLAEADDLAVMRRICISNFRSTARGE